MMKSDRLAAKPPARVTRPIPHSWTDIPITEWEQDVGHMQRVDGYLLDLCLKSRVADTESQGVNRGRCNSFWGSNGQFTIHGNFALDLRLRLAVSIIRMSRRSVTWVMGDTREAGGGTLFFLPAISS